MMKRLLAPGLCLIAMVARATPTTLTWATPPGWSQPTGGDQQFADSVTNAAGTTYALWDDATGALHITPFSPGGSAGTTIDMTGNYQIAGDLGLAMDSSGNFYVGGRTNSSNEDYGVEKYSSAGVLQWSTLSGIAGGAQGNRQGVKLDTVGNVYVVGATGNGGSTQKIQLMKLSASTGAIAWTRTGVSLGSNTTSGIAANPAGGLYVLENENAPSLCNTVYLSSYDASGNVAWSRTLGTCSGVQGMDYFNGNLYVLKDSRPVEYSGTDGHQIASGIQYFVGPGGYGLTSIAVDTGGTVYLGGTFYPNGGAPSRGAMIAYSANLTSTLWASSQDLGFDEGSYSFNLRASVDGSGNAYLTRDNLPPNNNGNCSSNGDLVWRQFDHATGNVIDTIQDTPLVVQQLSGVVSNAGNMFAVSRQPKLVFKYDSSGNVVSGWPVAYTSTVYCSNSFGGIAVGGSPAKLFVGMEVDTSSSRYIVVARFDAGTGAFETQYVTPPVGSNMDNTFGMIADAAGNVWLSANDRSGGGSSVYITSFDASGNQNWTFDAAYSPFGGPSPHIARDALGNIYTTVIAGSGSPQFGAVKLNSSGSLLWSTVFVGVNPGEFPLAIAVSGTTMFLVGAGTDNFNNPTFIVGDILAATTNGVPLWSVSYSGGQNVLFWDAEIAPSGQLLVSGQISSTLSLSGNGGPAGLGTADVLAQGWDPTNPCPSPVWSVRYDSGLGDDIGDFIEPATTTVVARTPAGFSLRRYAPGGGAPALSATIQPVPGPAQVGQLVSIALTVTNSGGRDVASVVPSLTITGGWAALAPLRGPDNTGPVSIQDGTGQVFTWTTTVTAAGTVTFSATGAGFDSCGGAPLSATITGLLVTGYKAILTPNATFSRTALGIGDWIKVSVTLTNTGINSALINTVSGTVAEASGPPTVLVGSSNSAIASLASSSGTTFNWTFSVSGAGNLIFSMSATGTDPIFGPLAINGGSPVIPVYDQAHLVASIVSGGGQHTASVGQWIPIGFSVSNTGSYAATNVTATAYVGPGGANVVLESGPTSLTLAPHTATVFVWTFSVSGAGPVAATMTATGKDTSPLGYNLLSSTVDSGTFQTPPAFAVSATQYATTVEIGQTYNSILSVLNTGQATADGVTIKVYDNGTATVTLVSGPTPPVQTTMTGGQYVAYSVTGMGVTAGTYWMTGSVTGIDFNSSATVVSQSFMSNVVTIVRPPVLTSSLAVFRAIADTGQTFLVTLTVTNTGGGTANGITAPALFTSAGTGVATQTAGPYPAMPLASLGVGATQTWTWTFTGSSAGTVVLTETVTGTSALSGNALSSGPVTAPGVLIQTPASLSGYLAAYRSTANVGQTLLVTYTVTNSGGAIANAVTPTTPRNTGAGTTSNVGPTPAGGTAMAGGASLTYTWTFTGVTSGNVVLTASATGADANTLAALAEAYSSATVMIQSPAALSATAYVSPAPLRQGQQFDLVVTVTNTGQATATNVANAGSYFALADLNLVSGPLPAGPFTLAGGAATTYIYSFQAVTPNAIVTFANTVTGTDANTGAPLLITGTRSEKINGFAVLGGWLSISNNTLSGGESSVVSLTVTNGGSDAAVNLLPVLNLVVSGTQCVDVVGPYPTSVLSLAKNGGVTTFSWTLTGRSRGTVDMTATVNGQDQLSSAAISIASSGVLSVQSSLNSSLAVVPSEVKVGQDFEVHFTVVNSDSVVGLNLIPLLFPVDPAYATLSASTPSALAPDTLSGNSSKTFTWKLTAVKAGPISFTATTTADFGGPTLDATKATVALTIKKAVDIPAFDGETLVYPNPVTGDLINVAVRLNTAMSGVVLDIYNTGFQRVYHGEWPSLPQGDSLLEISGAKLWAPGIYLARITANKTDGGTQPFKTFRIAVKVAK